MTSEHLEVERSYAVDDAWELPGLHDLDGVEDVTPGAPVRLEATYLDTEDLRLLRAGITLRRRTGGDDAGWHLKLPAGRDRLELGLPPGRSARTAPPALRSLVRSRVREAPVTPVARLRTRRLVTQLLSEGRVLAEVTDDHVTADVLDGAHGGGNQVIWREVEVELVAGDEDVLDAVERRLLGAGARPSPSPSKLGLVLGDRLPAPPPAPGRDAGSVVLAYVREQVEQLALFDPAVRREQPDAVHKMRVATRRLRSTLATFRGVLDRDVTDPVRDELKWLAGVLGVARDAEVLRAGFAALVGSQPVELVLGPVATRLDDELTTTRLAAQAGVVEALDSERYLALLDRLDALLADPPLTERAARRARKELARHVKKDWRRVRRLVGAGGDALHEARKAAKRTRYAAEASVPTFGDDAGRFASAMEDVQEVLGTYQDTVVSRDLLRRIGVEAHLDGENAFTFGRLHGLEEARGDAALARFDAVWESSSAKLLRRWL